MTPTPPYIHILIRHRHTYTPGTYTHTHLLQCGVDELDGEKLERVLLFCILRANGMEHPYRSLHYLASYIDGTICVWYVMTMHDRSVIRGKVWWWDVGAIIIS